MGKRSKLFKAGTHKTYNTVMKTRRKNKLAKVLPQLKDKTEKEIDIINEKDTVTSIRPKLQLRHRRVKMKAVMSRGQKKRKIKKIRLEIKKNIQNKAKNEKPNEKKSKETFNLNDIDNTLMDLIVENKDIKSKINKTVKNVKLTHKQKM